MEKQVVYMLIFLCVACVAMNIGGYIATGKVVDQNNELVEKYIECRIRQSGELPIGYDIRTDYDNSTG